MINAPRQMVLAVSADRPGLFPTMSGVRLLPREGLADPRDQSRPFENGAK